MKNNLIAWLLPVCVLMMCSCDKTIGDDGTGPEFPDRTYTASNAAAEHIFTAKKLCQWWTGGIDENGIPVNYSKDNAKLRLITGTNGKVKVYEGAWYKIELQDQMHLKFTLAPNTTGIERKINFTTQHYDHFEKLTVIQKP